MFNDTSTSALYSLSLHDALPICLGRRTVKAAWPEVGQVIAVRDIERGSSATEMLDAPASAYDGVYVLDRRGQRLLAVSSRFFGLRAQERRSEEHTSELQSRGHLVCRLLLEKKK